MAGGDPNIEYKLHGKLREPAPLEVALQRFELTVASLNDLCRVHDIALAYALIPHIEGEGHYDSMADVVRSSGAPLVELRVGLEREDYFAEGHLNRRGNRRVARALLNLLQEVR